MIAALLSAAALAGPAAVPPALAPGDTILVIGTPIVCTVGDGIVGCGLRKGAKQAPRTYAFVATDAFAIVLRADASSKAQLVVRQPQPKVGGPAFPARKPAGRTLSLGANVGATFSVPGSHVVCAVTPQRVVACGLFDRGSPARASYQTGLGSRALQLAQLDRTGNSVLKLVRIHGA
jgi:hypothetical protein